MLHVYVERFDVMGEKENILGLQTGPVSVYTRTRDVIRYGQGTARASCGSSKTCAGGVEATVSQAQLAHGILVVGCRCTGAA
jgi:hypothetical protein